MEVSDRILCGRNVTGGAGTLVLGEDVSDCCDINACAIGEPIEVTDNVAQLGLGFGEDGGREMGSRWDHVDEEARSIRGAGWDFGGKVK